jgi:general secretion pathway protein G
MNMILARRTSYARQWGFTLIELVVVMSIIVILAGAIALNISHRVDDAKRARALQDVHTLDTAAELYRADNGEPPPNLDALRTKPSPAPPNWNGPYLKKALTKDPWGMDYIYRYPGQLNPDGYDIISYGKDKQPGGQDADADITNAGEE